MQLANFEQIFLVYITVISILAAIVTILDKIFAAAGLWRVPESTLIILALAGGSAAMLVVMYLIRHKTRKKKFMVGIPVIILFQIAAGILYFVYK